MRLANASQMRSLDQKSITGLGIPGAVLMENAGRGTVEALVRHFGDPAGRRVPIFVGPGNNGGDGLVIARHLHQRGALPVVLLLVEEEKLRHDAGLNLAIVRQLAIPLHRMTSTPELEKGRDLLRGSWAAVDAIFGTGLGRRVEGHFAAAIELLNRFAGPVVAVDIPSGLHADTGAALGICVRAALTATFGLAKPGLVMEPGASAVGRLEVVDIGIPPEVVAEAGLRIELLDPEGLRDLLPPRQPASHKGNFGHLLIAGGSEGKTGAALLSGRGGLRSGAGLVTLCVPRKLNPVFEASLFEAMTLALGGEEDTNMTGNDFGPIMAACQNKQALALGPGLGTAPATAELVLRLYAECPLPMVVDADGLNILAAHPGGLKAPAGPRLLTPHPGEMARLVGRPTADIQADRLAVAADFAKSHQIHLVLKGARTVIAAPDGRLAVNPTGNPGMAAGGMGDVLTGLLGGLLAQGLPPWEAACLGVYSHGRAGDELAARMGAPLGLLAGELADQLPRVLYELTAPDDRSPEN